MLQWPSNLTSMEYELLFAEYLSSRIVLVNLVFPLGFAVTTKQRDEVEIVERTPNFNTDN